MVNVIIPTTSWSIRQKLAHGESIGIFFHSPTCGHCHEASAILHQILPQIPVPVYGINLVQDDSLATQFKLEGTPTLILVAGDTVVSRLVGLHDADTYFQFFTKAIEDGQSDDEPEGETNERDD